MQNVRVYICPYRRYSEVGAFELLYMTVFVGCSFTHTTENMATVTSAEQDL